MTAVSDPWVCFRQTLSFGAPVGHRNLLAIPLLLLEHGEEHPTHYAPIHEALSAGTVIVRETGQVSSLRLTCRSPDPVFAPAGSYLRGGGQDRMLVVSTVVAGEVEVDIPVRCVEARRWNPAGQSYEIPVHSSFVSTSLSSGSHRTDQRETWTTIEAAAEETVVDAPTRRLGDIYEQQAATLDDFRTALDLDRFPGRTVGILFVARSPDGKRQHWALDAFGRMDLFRTFFPGLRDAAAVTALTLAGRNGDTPVAWDNVPGSAEDEMLDLLGVETVTEEPTATARGRLRTAQPDAGTTVSVFEDQSKVLHVLARRTRS